MLLNPELSLPLGSQVLLGAEPENSQGNLLVYHLPSITSRQLLMQDAIEIRCKQVLCPSLESFMPISVRSPLINRNARRVAIAFLCALSCVLVLQRSPVAAQSQKSISRAEITQILDGPDVFIQNKQAKVKDAANKGQRVRTADARAQLLFNTGAVGRLAPNSVLTIGKCAQLRQGTLLVNGAMNGCTSSVVAGVRGTTYVLEVDEMEQARIKVLEGEVAIAKSSAPTSEDDASDLPIPEPRQLQDDDTSPVVLKEGEQVSLTSAGIPGAIEKMTQEEFSSLLNGYLFNGFSLQLPGISKIQQSFQRLFPGVPFPISLPRIPIPIPRPSFRLPF
ncbi:MAG: FecR domain-containing protein [Leptolyngbyaceae cyanobacterium RU_5_1]|nr:FecR domain-containing protein [Leptolyngbyaceae cyanobacterium RU_5_1]